MPAQDIAGGLTVLKPGLSLHGSVDGDGLHGSAGHGAREANIGGGPARVHSGLPIRTAR